jgi:H+/Cl- antiporter ClcA
MSRKQRRRAGASDFPSYARKSAPSPEIPTAFRDRGAGRFWLAVLLTGCLTGLGAGVLTLLLRGALYLSWGVFDPALLISAVHAAPAWRPVVLLFGAGVLTVGGRALLKRITTGGIDLTAAIWFEAGRMPLLRTAASAALSEIIVGMGASLGREGGPKQFGAVAANLFANIHALPDEQRRLLVAIGAGAGMAAVYNVPIGGALFALEVLRGALSLRLALPALAASVTATATATVFMTRAPVYIEPSPAHGAQLLIGAALAAPILGLASVALVRAIAWADRGRPGFLRGVPGTLLIFSSVGAIAIWRPEVLGNGQNITQSLFVSPVGGWEVFALLLLRPLCTVFCFATGAPGGLFTPSLAVGALVGAGLAAMGSFAVSGIDVGDFAFLGAGAMLAATTQGPISALVLLIELTGHVEDFALPTIVAVVGATLTSRAIEWRSIYEARLDDDQVAARAGERDARPHRKS